MQGREPIFDSPTNKLSRPPQAGRLERRVSFLWLNRGINYVNQCDYIRCEWGIRYPLHNYRPSFINIDDKPRREGVHILSVGLHIVLMVET